MLHNTLLINLESFICVIAHLLELDQHGGEHPELGALPGHLQQGQDHVLLVLLTHEVLGLEHDHVHHLEQAAELDEVEHIVPGKPGAGSHILQDREISFRNAEAGRLPAVFPPGQQIHDLRVLSPDSIGVLKLNQD